MLAMVSTYSGYVALSFLPPLFWLLFYLREDRHPEPKHLILWTFVAGVIAAGPAILAELALFGEPPVFSGFFHTWYPKLLAFPFAVFLGVGLIEEYVKYLAVKVSVLARPEFDEPVDAMIYMVASALGFAAVENMLFLIPVFADGFTNGLGLTANRFLGANLLHALSSAIVGYFLARHAFSPWRRHAVFAGVVLAGVLHACFNYFIIIRDIFPESIVLVGLLLVLMAVDVFVDFERLKKSGGALRPEQA